MLKGIQWLLRTGRSDPEQPAVTDAEIADMLENVKSELGGDGEYSERTQ